MRHGPHRLAVAAYECPLGGWPQPFEFYAVITFDELEEPEEPARRWLVPGCASARSFTINYKWVLFLGEEGLSAADPAISGAPRFM